jgi:hypothetical protein
VRLFDDVGGLRAKSVRRDQGNEVGTVYMLDVFWSVAEPQRCKA